MAFAFIKMLWLVVFVFMSFSNSKTRVASGESQVPCYFIFGDSVADPGNNNNLRTIAKANYPPYGIDFPQGVVTGRFCNGRTVVDIVAELLGFEDFIPRYVGIGNNILKGVNYASGAAGIHDESGRTQGARFSMNEQLLNHQIIVGRIALLLRGRNAAAEYLNKCIYTVGMGSNDYINNYFMPQSTSSRLYTPEQYATRLIRQYSLQLRTLYNSGARKVALIGLGQLGFTPIELARRSSGDAPTVFDINNAPELFNIRLKLLVNDFNSNLTNAKFTFINSTAISTMGTPQSPGFTNLTSPCCMVVGTNFTCEPNTTPCPNRNEYAFYDNIHPTEAANVFLGNEYYNATSPTFVHPYDLATLARL